jgi:hypothetical protein
MPALGGFEIVAELTVGVLEQIFNGAWDNNIVPHSVDIPAGTAFGPYAVADGVINIPRAGLALAMEPAINGVHLKLGIAIQVELANPPVPSARLFDMTSDVTVRMPILVLPGTIQVAAGLGNIERPAVAATLTSGDPVPPITLALVKEYVHARYADGTIPPTITQTGVAFDVFTGDVFVEIFDDDSNAARSIEVSQPTPGTVKISLPAHVHMSNLSAASGPAPRSPMGVTARIAITADLVAAPGSLTARFSTSTVVVEDLAPAAGVEGANYGINRIGASAFGIDLESLLKSQIQARGQAIATALGDPVIAVPTVAMIETFIADQAHAAIVGRGNVGLWTPTPPPGDEVTVTDVKPLALADSLAICLNNPAGNTAEIVNFIPAGRSCAIALDGAVVLRIIREQINKPESEGGFGGVPHTFPDIDGHEAKLTRLDPSLRSGSIHLEGDVTVVDAIAGSIDVDASFEAEVGLQWEDNPGGGQMVKPFVISKDVDLSILGWIISFLLGFISMGLVGGIIALVVMAVVEGIAERIGGAIIRDEVTGQIKGIGAWPQTLEGIGSVTARFENPVAIDPQSIVFADAYTVAAIFGGTLVAFAESNGPYVVDAGSPVLFNGGPAVPDTSYAWDFGDGATATGMSATHTYVDNGIYVAKLTTTVNQPGGVRTREFARVRARNVPPVVDAGPDLEIDEGQQVEYLAAFTDQEWPDTHQATWDFGDDSVPVTGTVSETHLPPAAAGTTLARHAYCDSGEYLITVKVRDDDGGVGVATRKVKVRNVAPTVDAGPDLFAYPCTPITLRACFTDPGWCDTHTAVWEFGDCTPPHPAVVRETHRPPQGVGAAAAVHRYESCGTFLARCTVTDDDGGVGQDTIVVQVTDIANRDFEGGFHGLAAGQVANEWQPYRGAAAAHGATAAALYEADEFVVHGGQRSQRVNALGAEAGIWQQFGANVGWDYQVSVWYQLDQRSVGATARLGLDPRGGLAPDAASVEWSVGTQDQRWAQLTVLVTATAASVTVFLEVRPGMEGAGGGWFDSVDLLASCCALAPCHPAPLPSPERDQCIDWKGVEPMRVGGEHSRNGFTFRALLPPLQLVTWGPPASQTKLQIPVKGVVVTLPFAAGRFVAHLVNGSSRVLVQGFDAKKHKVAEVATNADETGIQTIAANALGVTVLLFSSGDSEGLLIDLCIFAKESNDGDPRAFSFAKH